MAGPPAALSAAALRVAGSETPGPSTTRFRSAWASAWWSVADVVMVHGSELSQPVGKLCFYGGFVDDGPHVFDFSVLICRF